LKQDQPYGSWVSELSSQELAKGAKRLSEPRVFKDEVLWLEGRPEESGRTALVKFDGVNVLTLGPDDLNVRTLVHEYGGGSWLPTEDGIWLSNFDDQRLWLLNNDFRPVTPEPSISKGLRYSNGVTVPDSGDTIWVVERHRESHAHPENLLATVNTAGTINEVASGADFYSSPTISNITGVTQSIEPTYQNLYVKSNLSGEFTIVNPHLVRKLKALDLWDDVMINDLKYFEGSLSEISRIPDDIKKLFSTAFEVEPQYIVESASRRQKWIDQAQSLNLYIGNANGKKLDLTYRMAWYSGLKTTYYLRSIAATTTEKSTINQGSLNAVSAQAESAPEVPHELGAPAPVPEACSLDDPDCEACQ